MFLFSKIFLLILILLLLLIGFRIYHLDSDKHLNRMFLLLCLSVAWVGFCEYELLKTDEQERAEQILSWMSFLVINASLITYIIYLHLQRYQHFKNGLVQNLLHLFMLLPTLVFFYFHLYDPLLYYQPIYIDEYFLWTFTFQHTIFYFCFLVWLSINALLLSYFSYLAYQQSLTTYERSWNRTVFFSICILSVFALGYYYLTYFFQISIIIYSTPFMFILIFGLAWAFSNFKLFEVSPLSAIQNIMDSSSNLMFLTDLSNNIQRVNSTAQKVLGIDTTTLLDQNIHDLFQEVNLVHLDTVPNEHLDRYVQLVNHKKGTQYFYLNVSKIQDLRNQRTTGYVYAATDITSLQQVQIQMLRYNQALQKVNDELADFAEMTSEVLQYPLKVAEKNVRFLRREYMDKIGTEGKFYIHYALSANQRMQRLLNNLLQYSKVNQTAEEFSYIFPLAIIQEKIADLYHFIEEKKALIEVRNIPNNLYCQPQQLGIVFYNLLHNALKFNTHLYPVIQIVAFQQKDAYLFSVIDNGIGIPIEQKENIFMIFKRLHRKEAYDGTGLGLAMCRKIVEKHGGKIWLETAVEEGSVFHFTIPLGSFENGK